MPTRTDAIKRFLEAHTHPDLASLYNHDMEMQCNVAQDGGARVDGDFKGKQWHGWTDNITTWKSFRVPYKANSEPEYEERDLNFDLEAHAEGIGMTGWDWVARKSRWVAFDFDSITGHSDKHARKLSDIELDDVAKRISNIPWCTLRRSTSGKGLHLYVFLEGVETKNHTEHAALSRAILSQLTALTRFDFSTKVDVAGGNMWVWHRKMKGTNGLTLLKAGEKLTDVPLNWKDHINVVSGRRKKILPSFIEKQKETLGDIDQWFEDVTSKQSRTPLDEEHTKLIEYLRNNNCSGWWDADHWMLVTHTYHLKEAHEKLNLRGKFDTLATGTEAPGDHNVFAFPLRKGAWALRRYTPGVMESANWDQDGARWTRCFFNKDPDLKAAARAYEGLEHPTGGYSFKHCEQAKQASEMLGAKIELPPWILNRPGILKEHKDGRLIIEIEHYAQDSGATGMEGWIAERGKYKRVFDVKARDINELDVSAFDDMIRHVVSTAGDDMGWLMKSEGSWKTEPLTHVKHGLVSLGFSNKEVNLIIGSNIMKCWTIVNRPFQDEYPTGREWNRNAAQFRFRPNENTDDLKFPTWTKILSHTGAGLNKGVLENSWCQANGILNGGDYLKCWIASMFQYPLDPLPYLFLFSQVQNNGKTIFHEAISLLVTHGVVRIDQALDSAFNGELANAILCVIEETDLGRNKVAYNKIKDWVTARELSIRALFQPPYMNPNSTHYVQTANDHKYCPSFPGDTRIVYCKVPELAPGTLIPKKVLIPLLEKEAPDFLAAILNLELPQSPDRLNLPVIVTQEKLHAEETNNTHLEIFIKENTYEIPGELMKFTEFFEKFIEWLEPGDRYGYTKIRVGRELPPQFPRGRHDDQKSTTFIGNISWLPPVNGELKKRRVIKRDDYLVQEST